MITIEDFSKLEIKIGTILSAEKVPEADKLIKLEIDLGSEKRQIMSGIAEWFPEPSVLVGKQVPILVNLAPRKFRGYESQGMVLMADAESGPVLLHPTDKVLAGSTVR